MKFHKCLSILFLIGSFSLLVSSAHANMIINPTVIRLFFEKDGLPYDQSVKYSINCYRYLPVSVLNNQSLINTNETAPVENALSLSGNCLYYGCPVYTHVNKFYTDTCDLEGHTMGRSFIIRNFSNIPATYCINPIHQYDIQKGYWSNISYYKFTPEYQDCMKRIQPLKDQCNQYTYTCDVQISGECGGVVMSGHEGVFLSDPDAFKKCIAPYDKEHANCESYLAKIDQSSMIMYNDNRPASRYCESHFTIPSFIEMPKETPNLTLQKKYPQNTPYKTPTTVPSIIQTQEIVAESTISSYVPMSPVESFYCTILSIFGAKC